jgi:hypothetical protein
MTEERFPKVNAMAREEGWGKITDEALGILPENVESQARSVASWAHECLAAKDAEIARLRDALIGLLDAVDAYAETPPQSRAALTEEKGNG